MRGKSSLKILYVEDDPVLSQQYGPYLNEKCEKLYFAQNGIKALDIFNKVNPDLIITDLRMPLMDGIEMIKEIRKISQVPIIVTSAFSESDSLVEAINMGITKYILKPFNKNTFERVLDDTIEFLQLRQEKDLHNKELETIFNTISEGICLVDSNLKLKKYNDFFKNLFYPKSIIESDSFLKLIDDSIKTELKTMFSTYETNTEDLELKISNEENKELYITLNANVMPDFKHLLITLQNITKEKEYKKILDDYYSLIDERIITSRTDLAGKITYVSKAFCKISGYSKEELLGESHNIVRDPLVPDDIYRELWNSLNEDDFWSGELRNINKNGEHYWVDATISPIYVDSKKIGYSSVREDITSKKILEEMATKDGLTNIYNRRFFDDTINNAINNAKRRDENLCLLMIDIDYFKLYNDNYGHQEGDRVLKSVAQTINSCMQRAGDYTFRLGGEEFAVLFTTNTKKEAIEFTKIIQKKIDNLNIEHAHSKVSQNITVSIGLLFLNAKNIKSDKEFYKNADELLYKAKANGRNQIVYNEN